MESSGKLEETVMLKWTKLSYFSDIHHCIFSEDYGILTLKYRMESSCKLSKITRFSSFAFLLASLEKNTCY